MPFQIIVPPTVEPVTLAEVKARLRLTSTANDATITQQITAAREYAEKMTRQCLAPATFAASFDRFPQIHRPIALPMPPLVDVTGITFLDENMDQQTWDPAEYFVASNQVPGLIVPVPGFIYPPSAWVPGAVTVTFTAGTGTIPQHLAEAIRQLAVYIFDHPETITSEGLKEAPLSFKNFFTANKVWVF